AQERDYLSDRWSVQVGHGEPDRPGAGPQPRRVRRVAKAQLALLTQAYEAVGADALEGSVGLRPHEMLAAQPQPARRDRKGNLVHAAVPAPFPGPGLLFRLHPTSLPEHPSPAGAGRPR